MILVGFGIHCTRRNEQTLLGIIHILRNHDLEFSDPPPLCDSTERNQKLLFDTRNQMQESQNPHALAEAIYILEIG